MAKRATASNGSDAPKRGRGRPRKDSTAPASGSADAPATPAPTTMATTAQERWDKHFDGIKEARVELDKVTAEQKKIVGPANSRYRNALKAFKKDGGNVDALIRTLNDQLRPIDEVERDNRDYNAYAKFAGLPIGTQLGLFADGSSVASAIDNERIAQQADDAADLRTPAQRIANAKIEGYEAGTDGKFPSANPYEDGSPEYLAWEGSRMDAQAKLAEKFGARAPAASEPAHAA